MFTETFRRSSSPLSVLPIPPTKHTRKHAPTHLESFVDQALFIQLLEHPPHALHESGVQRLVVILKVDPAAQACHRLLPLLGVAARQLRQRRGAVKDTFHSMYSREACMWFRGWVDGHHKRVGLSGHTINTCKYSGPTRRDGIQQVVRCRRGEQSQLFISAAKYKKTSQRTCTEVKRHTPRQSNAPHHNAAALLVVLVDAHLQNIVPGFNA